MGSSLGCCICSYCCVNESMKVDLVLEKFPGTPVCQAEDGIIQRLIGHCVLAGQQPFYSPVHNKPCVYFRLIVEKEHVTHRDGKKETRWEQVVDEEFITDFYIQEANYKVFIKGSERGTCKISSEFGYSETEWSCWNHDAVPSGVQAFLDRRRPNWNSWWSSGRYRYREAVFEVNEKLSCLGICTPGIDPFTGAGVKILNPIQTDRVGENYMEEHEWSDWTRRAWADLTQVPSVACTDAKKLTRNVTIDPVQNLPQWQTQYNPNYYQQYGQNAYASPSYQNAVQPPQAVPSYSQGMPMDASAPAYQAPPSAVAPQYPSYEQQQPYAYQAQPQYQQESINAPLIPAGGGMSGGI